MINFSLKTLKNGIRLITCPMDSTEATTIQIMVGTGARFDSLDKSGISHFLEHMFFNGSKNYPTFSEVTHEFDSIGAGYNASTSYEAIRFYLQTCSVDFKRGYNVLKDCFQNPLFKEEFLEKEKGIILEEIKMYKDMPQAWTGILNQQQVFSGHPLGADLGGDETTVRSITRDDLVSNWNEHYSPEQMIIALCGRFDQKTVEMIEKDFENIPPKTAKKFLPFDPDHFEPSTKQEVRPIDQANFIISFPAFKKPDDRRFALNVMDIILGASPSSRLYTEIREKRGLAYDVGSGINSYFDTGSYYIYGGVKADQVEEVYKIILEEIKKITEEGVSTEELERAKGNLRGTITRSLESSFSIADYLCSSLYWHKKILPPDEILNRYNAVTAEQVQEVAKEIFDPKKAIITVVGPKEYNIAKNQELRAKN